MPWLVTRNGVRSLARRDGPVRWPIACRIIEAHRGALWRYGSSRGACALALRLSAAA